MEHNIHQDDALLVLLSYGIPLVPALIILFSDKKNDKFLAYHSWQSIVLWGAMVVASVVVGAFFNIYFIQPLAPFFLPLFYLAIWLFAWWCGYRAFQGEYVKIPIVTDIAGNLSKGPGNPPAAKP